MTAPTKTPRTDLRPPQVSRRAWMWAATLGCVLVAAIVSGCGLFRGAINDSPAIRWWLFSNFGAERMCPEMLKRGAPLALTPGQTIGRFFPNKCTHVVNDQTQTLTVQFSGSGYAWTPVAGRVGFEADVTVEYRPDFYLDEDAIYVWGVTNQIVAGPTFTVLAIENKFVDWAAQGPGAYLASTFGQQIVSSKLSQGFTVVRTHSGDDFAIGILRPPQRPIKPFEVEDDERLVLANEATQVHGGQVDFLGPFEVVDEDHHTFFRWRSGGPRAEAFVFPRMTADQWRETLQRGAPLGQPPGPAIVGFPLEVGEHQMNLRLPPGQYVIVVDNSPSFGSVNPPWNPLAPVGSGALSLSYIVELGEE